MPEKRNGYIKWALDLAAEDSQYQRMLTEIRVAEKKYNELLSAMPMEEQDIIFDFVSFVYGFSNSGKRLSEFIKIINIANIDGTVLFVIDWFLNSKTNIAVRIQVNQF